MASADDLRRIFTLANAFKEGDLAVGGTRDDAVRDDARRQLLDIRVGEIRRAVFVDDGVSDAIERYRERSFDSELDTITIGRLKDTLLAPGGHEWARARRHALPSEAIAAVAKVMTDEELGRVAHRLFHPIRGGIGASRHFGSRIQPNSPGDDEEEILFSILEGLAHGCGDVIIGLNPAADELETIVRLEQQLARVIGALDLPTRFCVLSDIVKQDAARQRTRVDVGFQSLAGTDRALAGMVGLDTEGIVELARAFDGLYFETGQGSAVTNGTAAGVDMVTLEARAYGVARVIHLRTGAWMIVNDVAGFIGPEVFRTAEQLLRACLEDLVMAKLHGITMGLDVCATFHMGIPPSQLRALTSQVVRRGAPAYLMAVAGNADPMLGYLTTSFRQHPAIRRETGTSHTAAMAQRLAALNVLADGRQTQECVADLYARYCSATGEQRSMATLAAEGRRKIGELQERGFDIALDAASSDARAERLYEHARRALYSTMSESVLRDVCPVRVHVKSCATDRDDFIAHPPAGERITETDLAALRRLPARHRGPVQIAISDGLNADAISEQLRSLLPPLRRVLADGGHQVAESVVVVANGRVRAGYDIARALDPVVLIHVIGERPGTGLNSASAYVTYGRDDAGGSRWDPQLDHSHTTAVCGIHPRGKPPEAAAAEIGRTVRRIFEQRRSGVSLR